MKDDMQNFVGEIYHKPALDTLQSMGSESIDMIYTDPPFGTGNIQTMARKKSGKIISKIQYSDKHKDYLDFLKLHVEEMHRVLKNTATLYLHLDYRWVHYAKVFCDNIFGYENFLNELIWSYDFGGRGRDRWPSKHDTILVYAKERGKHTFNWNDIDRIPYLAPELQKDPARAAEGKVPTDVWWMSIVGTNSKERIGYPNQKPIKLIKRMIIASSNLGDVILDPFAGSGSTGDAALKSGRRFILSDCSQEAIDTMKKRFSTSGVNFI